MGTALITGASAGLGAEYAWQLAAARHNLVLVARRTERLEELAAQIRAVAGVHVEVLPADLSDQAELDRVVSRISDDGERPVGLLVNNAGFGLAQRFVGGSLEKELYALDVMVRTVMILSHAAAAAMLRRGHGAILNVSSMTENTAMGTYAAHKAWVRAFTEGLATELAGSRVSATAVLPGLVRTEFHAVAKMKAEAWPEYGWLTAERVVSSSLDAVRRGDVLCIPSARYKTVSAALKFLPRTAVRHLAGVPAHAASHGAAPRSDAALDRAPSPDSAYSPDPQDADHE